MRATILGSMTGLETPNSTRDPYRYTAEHHLELSVSLGQLGVYHYSISNTFPSTKHLLDQRSDSATFEHETGFLGEKTRSKVIDDLKEWTQRRRIKPLLKKRAKDQIWPYLDKVRALNSHDDNSWLQNLALPDHIKLTKLVEERGLVDILARYYSNGKQEDPLWIAEQRRITNLFNKPSESKLMHAYFRMFDEWCEMGIPALRSSWLFRASYMHSQKKASEARSEEPRTTIWPRQIAELLVHYLLFNLTEPVKGRPTNSAVQTGQNTKRSALTTSPALDGQNGLSQEKIDRWRRGASLLRWMFEDSHIRPMTLFDEFIRVVKAAFGQLNEGSVAANPRSQSPVAPSVGSSSSGPFQTLKLGEAVQLLVLSEVSSYAPEAVKMGFAPEFLICFRGLARHSTVQHNAQMKNIVDSVIDMCELALVNCSAAVSEAVLEENPVGLTWDLEERKLTRDDELERLPVLIWESLVRNGYSNPLTAGIALLEWLCAAPCSHAQDSSLIACLGLEELYRRTQTPLRDVFIMFLTKSALVSDACASAGGTNNKATVKGLADETESEGVRRGGRRRGRTSSLDKNLTQQNQKRLKSDEEKKSSTSDPSVALIQILARCSWVLSLLVTRGTHISLEVRPVHKKKPNDPETLFLHCLAATEFASKSIRNASTSLWEKNKFDDENTAKEFLRQVIKTDFALETKDLIRILDAIKSPTQQILILSVLIENGPAGLLFAGVIPRLKSSLLLRYMIRVLEPQPSSDVVSNLEEQHIQSSSLRRALEMRKNTATEPAEIRRLKELIAECVGGQTAMSDVAAPTATASAAASSRIASTVTSRQRTRNPVHMLTVGLSEDVAKPPKHSRSEFVSQSESDMLHIKSICIADITGEQTRYEEGLTLMSETPVRVAEAVKAQVEKSCLPRDFLFESLALLVACRTRDEHEQLCGWCVNELAENPEGAKTAVNFGLCRVEDLLNKWLTRKFVPPPEVFKALVESSVAEAHIRRQDAVVVRYAWLLATLPNLQGADFLRIFAKAWASRGPLAWEQRLENSKELSLMLARILLSEPSAAPYRSGPHDVFLDVHAFAQWGWVAHPSAGKPEEVAEVVIDQMHSHGKRVGTTMPIMATAWQAQSVVCARARPLFRSGLNAAMVACVTKCLINADFKTRMNFAEMCGEAVLRCDIDGKTECALLGVVKAALSKPDSPETGSSLPQDFVLKLLLHIQPMDSRGLALDLLRRVDLLQHKRTVAALIVSWKSRWPEEIDFFARCHRVLLAGLLDVNGIGLVDNQLLCGEVAALVAESRFVDAWSTLEGARESDANYEFMRSAILKQTARS